MTEMPVPMSADQLDAPWLTEALRHAGHLAADESVSSLRRTVIGEGIGMVGQLVRLEIEYAGGSTNLPPTMIAKLPSPFEANRAQMQAFRYYVREALFYREVAPRAGVRTPKCWWSAIDNENNLSALLLEDVGHLQVSDQIEGMSPDLAERAIRAIARLHAQWWEKPELDALDWMDYGNGPVTMQAVPLFEFAWPLYLANGFGDLLSADQVALGERVRDHFERLLNDFGGQHRTICHTDFRSENMFFGEPGSDDEVVILDWQLTTRSGGLYDVAYLLAQSLTVDDRRAHEERLLRLYHRCLTEHGLSFTFDEIMEFYRVGLMVCLVIPVSVGGLLDTANERGRRLGEVITERTFTAAIDHNCGAVLDARYGGA
ncbi:MAG: oxidoreductase family protein [Ilumatobacteraceae bacterium]